MVVYKTKTYPHMTVNHEFKQRISKQALKNGDAIPEESDRCENNRDRERNVAIRIALSMSSMKKFIEQMVESPPMNENRKGSKRKM